jgi:putative ABC transport system permease protein
MLKATLRGFLTHRGRMALSLLAVVLSVAFVAGTLMFTDTIGSTFDRLFRSTAADVTITPASPVGNEEQQAGSGAVLTMPQSVAARAAGVPGAAAARAAVQVTDVTLVNSRNRNVGSVGGAPTIALSWNPGPTSPVELTSGHVPTTDGQALIDADTARKQHLGIGDRLRVIAGPGAFPERISGIATFTTTNPGAALVFLDPHSAQTRLLGRTGRITQVEVTAAKGVSDAALKSRLTAAIGSGYDVRTRSEQAKSSAQQLGTFLSVMKDSLLGFAGIALLVGISLILNTFSMLVAQRTRELGLLRALGASRRQVNRSVLAEAVLLGVVGSTLGLALGVGLALGLMKLIGAFGMVLKASQVSIHWTTPVAAYGVGIVVTAVAAYLPARRASQVSPMAALQSLDTPQSAGPMRRRALIGGGVVLVAAAALAGAAAVDSVSGSAELLGAGVLLSLIGLVITGPLLARPVIRAIGGWFPRVFGAVGRLSQRNALRNPRRTGATAAALMIGLALVGGLSVTGSSMAASFNAQVDKVFGADFGIETSQGASFPAQVAQIARSTPGVGLVVRGRTTPATLGTPDGAHTTRLLAGYDPDAQRVLHVTYARGSAASGSALGHLQVSGDFAASHRLRLGSPVSVLFPNGRTARLTVGAITPTGNANGQIAGADAPQVGLATLQRYDPQVRDSAVLVDALPNADKSKVKSALGSALASYPQVTVRDQTDYKTLIRGQIDVLLNLVYGLLGLAIIIAVLGVVNTLALSVVERTREIGLLRAVGMARLQLRRMIRLESVVIAVFGAALGMGLGLVWGLTAHQLLALKGFTALSVPWATVIGVVLGSAVVGLIAALGPALRASRLNVLAAIAHE